MKAAPSPHWNYEPCSATLGTVVCGRPARPTWWCAPLEGRRLRCVRVELPGSAPFYICNVDGQGYRKIFLRGGGPDSPHRSIPVDDHSTFIPSSGTRTTPPKFHQKGAISKSPLLRRRRTTGGHRRRKRSASKP